MLNEKGIKNDKFITWILRKCGATFVLVLRIKTHCLSGKMAMLFWDSYTHPCEQSDHRAGSQLKNAKVKTFNSPQMSGFISLRQKLVAPTTPRFTSPKVDISLILYIA